MSLNVDEANLKFLATISQNQQVGIDQDGRLFIIKEQETSAAAFAKALLKKDKNIHRQAALVVKNKIKEKDPQDVSATIDIFVKNELLNLEEVSSLVSTLVDKRKQDLLKEFEEPDEFDNLTAEAIVVAELAFDPFIPEAIREKIKPELTKEGLGGTYILKDRKGMPIGIFKPKYQEYRMPFNPRVGGKADYDESFPLMTQLDGHIQGTSWLNEIAAYKIDDGFMGVPETTEISILFPTSPDKPNRAQQLGSFQRFVQGVPVIQVDKTQLDPLEVQKIALFDILIANGDRNTQNILYHEGRLTPIDHGLAFLINYELRSEWRFMPQLKKPVDPALKKWIAEFDIDASCSKLNEMGVNKEAIFIHRVMHLYLKKQIAAGKNLYEIAEDCFTSRYEDTTKIDQLVSKAREALSPENRSKDEIVLKKLSELMT